MELTNRVKVPFTTKGKYSVVTKNGITGETVKDKCFSVNNTVTLSGKDWFFRLNSLQGNGTYGALQVGFGSGVSEVIESDTNLGGTTVIKGAASVPVAPEVVDAQNNLAKVTFKRTAVFSPGEAVGTFGQVGLFSSGSTLVAGQVLRDLQGQPTTVTFLAIEEVTVTYEVEVTLAYAPGVVDSSSMVESPAQAVTVLGNPHNITMLGIPFFVGTGIGSISVLADPAQGVSTILNAINNRGQKVFMKVAPSASAPEGDWSFVEQFTDYYPITVEVLELGRRYKVSTSHTIPYTNIQDVYIKEVLGLGEANYPGNIGVTCYNSVGGFKIDPPIFKAAGYELKVDFNIIYELV